MSLSELPSLSGTEHEEAFRKLGWVTRRAGNHIIMTHPASSCIVSIPNHREVKRTTLHTILKGIGISDAQYRALFD